MLPLCAARLPRCAALLPRGSMAAKGMPRCCRGAQHGCLGDANVRNMAAEVQCRSRGSKAAASMKIHAFTFGETWVTPCQVGMPTFVYIGGDCELG